MNLLQAAESIIRSRMDEYGFIMNSCLHDQKTENLDNIMPLTKNSEKYKNYWRKNNGNNRQTDISK